MTKPSLIARCTLSEQCLPDAPYRAMLCKLHKDMLDEIDRLKAAQPAPVQDKWVGTVVDSGYGYKVIGFAPGTLTDIPVNTRCYVAAPEKGQQ
jgi:hypothetical protein